MTLATLLASLALGAPLAAPSVPLPSPLPPVERVACVGFGLPASCVTGGEIKLDPAVEESNVLAHELGHVVDERYLDAGERQRFLTVSALSKSATPARWYATAATDEESYYRDSPGEWFAESYAHCLLPKGYRLGRLSVEEWSDSENPAVTHGRRLRRVCGVIRRAMNDRPVAGTTDASPAQG